MYSFQITTLIGIVIHCILLIHIGANGASINNNTDLDAAKNSSSNSTGLDLDDRFNLNFNLAGAHGIGHHGGFSQANSLSYGVNAGIRGPGGHYQNLFNNAASNSNGYSSGPGAPLSFANTGSRVRPGYGGGHANSGVLGGQGNAFAQSINQNIEIPLDNRGTVFLSNLKEPPSSTSSSNANSGSTEQTTETTSKDKDQTSTTSASKEKATGALVFS